MKAKYESKLDHLVLATPDLSDTVKAMTSLLGVAPTPGGKHAGLGTENFLVSLGPRQYLEIIGPDTTAGQPAMPRPFGIDTLAQPKLVTWAISEQDLDASLKKARESGYDPGVVVPMSRQLQDGQTLQWRLVIPRPTPQGFALPGDGVVPFIIDWGSTPHPAQESVPGCQLIELRGIHPDPSSINAMGAALDISIAVVSGPAAGLVAVLSTPAGLVELR